MDKGYYEDSSDCAWNNNSESDVGMDNDYDAGEAKTRSIRFRHLQLFVARNAVEGEPNVLLAKVTLMHTKGEGNNPRVYVLASFER